MQTLRTLGKANDDGVLHLDIPVGAANAEYEVVIVLQPRVVAEGNPRTPEELGWPPGFFEETAGRWQGDLVRDQGKFEERDEF